jgi:hypothetical protein
MLAGAGGVRLPFVGVGEATAVEEVVAECGLERGLVLRAGGDAGAGIGGVAVVGTGSLISPSVVNAVDAGGWWRRGWSYCEK